jgi:hypothetical protein
VLRRALELSIIQTPASPPDLPDAPVQARLHPINRKHLAVLTGELGIFQHAAGSEPDPTQGHSVDDVARSLEVDLLHARTLGWDAVAESARRNLRFLEDGFDATTGRFVNARQQDGEWTGGPGSHDSYGRVMLALGETIAAAPDAPLVGRATALFARALPAAGKVTSPRGQAGVVLACAAMTRPSRTAIADFERDVTLDADATATMRRLATVLHARFLDYAQPGWPWPEEALTHENALLPRALIIAAGRLKADAMGRIGLQVLDWLIAVQTAPEGHFSLVGNGAWKHRGEKSQFDQRPIEATSLLQAADAAYSATGDPRYLAAMERAYAWFLGANDLGRKLANPARGAGSDGLTPRGANANEGAESTLMWLMASEHIRALRSQPPRARILGPRSSVLASALAPAARAS